ncbi:hypothetical protein [Atlantibacter hermannii]|uniref:hypothetical protein n=1 Tax=Atlantibacter hermannii TaxID=565 RepID=UPI00289A3705|nr:hypothetical protein [Atlantibacter hermannii]
MGTTELILSGLLAFVLAVLGAFGIGRRGGKRDAEQKAEAKRIDEYIQATNAVTEKRIEASKGAADVQQSVNLMPDDDVDRELRQNFTRKT